MVMRWIEEPDRAAFEGSDQKHTRQKTADMRKPGHATARLTRAQAAAYELKQKPDAQSKPGGYVHEAREKAEGDQDQNLGPWIEQKVGSQYS